MNETSKKRIKTRDSNMELLRIILMLFITCHHFLLFGIHHGAFSEKADEAYFWVLNSFFYIGVNGFILISGFYGIRTTLKGFFNLYAICAFYGLCCYMGNTMYSGEPICFKGLLINTFLCLSHNNQWFINGYVVLYLSAPLLNKAIDQLNKRNYIIILLLYSILNLYFGYFWKNPGYNVNGYCAAQFIYLYLVGRYIHLFVNCDRSRRRALSYLLVYLLCTGLYIALSFIGISHSVPHWDPWKYNNPVLLISSIAFFMCFASIRINSEWINRLAVGTFAVFLIQQNMTFVYPFVGQLYDCILLVQPTIMSELIFVLACAVLFMMLVLFVDFIRVACFRPVWFLFHKIEPLIRKIGNVVLERLS